MSPERSSFPGGISRRKLLTGGVLTGISALTGCSSLLSNEQTIELTARDITFEEYPDEAEDSAQILLNRDDQTLAISGLINTSNTVTKLYPQVLTTSANRSKIQVRIQPSTNENQSEDLLYRYLAHLKFNWIPDTIEVIVQHESRTNDIQTVVSRVLNTETSQEST